MATCLLCEYPEDRSQSEEFVCSRCVIKIAQVDRNVIRQAIEEGKKRGLVRKVQALEILGQEEEYVPKTEESRRVLARGRAVRKVRPHYRTKRAEPIRRGLDQRGAQIYREERPEILP